MNLHFDVNIYCVMLTHECDLYSPTQLNCITQSLPICNKPLFRISLWSFLPTTVLIFKKFFLLLFCERFSNLFAYMLDFTKNLFCSIFNVVLIILCHLSLSLCKAVSVGATETTPFTYYRNGKKLRMVHVVGILFI